MKPASVEAQINSFLEKYSLEVAGDLRAARAHLQSLFPRGHELVYDNYNALVFAFAPTERTPEAFVSVAGYPKWVTLFFAHGAQLHDPSSLLQGTGSRVRSIRLRSAQQLSEPAIQALIEQAIHPHREALRRAGPRHTSVKLVSAKQRPRRPPNSAAKVQNAA